jgi:P4 family phage/plasmid primase-like protien
MKKSKSGLQLQASSKPIPFAGARRVCEAIHGDYGFTVVRFKRKEVANAVDGEYGLPIPAGRDYCSHDTLEEHVKRFPQYQNEGLEVFAVVAASDGGGHRNENVLHTWALAVDFDYGYPEYLVGNHLIGPSFRVQTSPGHYHAVWVLDEPCQPDDAKPVLVAMALRLGGDVAFAKVSQMLRLPGFTHHKHGTVTKLVEVIKREKPYTLQFLKQAFDVEVVQNHMRVAVPRMNAQFEVKKDKSNEHDEAQIVEDVESALPYLKDYAEDYKGWFSTLSALASLGERGKQLAETFSRYSNKFDARAFEQKWADVQKQPGYVATIFSRAMKNGWANPGFRNTSTSKGKALTERRLGRLIAAKMVDQYAVTESEIRGKRHMTFFKLGLQGFVKLSTVDLHTVIEHAALAVIADLKENTRMESKALNGLEHQYGTISKLNAAIEHVGEELVQESFRRKIGNYPYLVVTNGILNLLSQELVPALYRAVPHKGPAEVVFDPAAEAPIFARTVKQAFEGNEGLIRYFYQLLGYMLCGNPKEQIFVIMFGPSAGNGKNTLMDVVMALMGEYFTNLKSSVILVKSHVTDSATPSIARLEGRRMAVVSELSDRHTLDSGMIKSMTGDQTLAVRDNYESGKDIPIEFLLVMMTNKLPKVQSDDNGLWRRLKIIPFNRVFRGAEVDTELPVQVASREIRHSYLMLAGARDYMINGLIEPAEVTRCRLLSARVCRSCSCLPERHHANGR